MNNAWTCDQAKPVIKYIFYEPLQYPRLLTEKKQLPSLVENVAKIIPRTLFQQQIVPFH